MSSIKPVGKGEDRRYRARYRTPDGESRSKTFKRKADAENFLTSVEHSKLTGAYVDQRVGRMTFGDYAVEWQKRQVHRETTRALVGTHLAQHILPTFAHRPIGSVRPTEVQAWVRGRSEKLAPSTVELVYRYLAAIFKAAVTDRIIATSPCVGVKLPRVEKAPVVPLEIAIVTSIAAEIAPRYRATVILAAGTGLRQGECFGLTVDRVDFLRRNLRVDRQMITVQGSGPVKGHQDLPVGGQWFCPLVAIRTAH